MKRVPAQRRSWVRLDNAANIFLAARSDVDSKVFRLAAELDEPIVPEVLQEALDRVYAQYPLFSAVLRQGVFWYYLQQSDLRPTVSEETGPPVQHLYHHQLHDLLFRVVYRGRRISAEIFHALTDGTGALWFFEDLLTEYVGLRHVEEFHAVQGATAMKQDFTVDAFTHWFRSSSAPVTFEDDATAAVESPSTELPAEVDDGPPATTRRRHRRRDVLRMRGTHSPDLRTRVIELSMPVGPVLRLAKAEGVSLTIYLLAAFFDSVRRTRVQAQSLPRTLTCSVPVNLRQFFPTASGRNFFATTMLAHTYTGDDDADSISGVCADLDRQLRQVLSKEGLARKIRRLVRFERNPVLRIIPRPLKDVILGSVNALSNRGITLAISNLGSVVLPEPVGRHVGRLYLHVAAVRPQFGAVSHGDQLTISFTSPFIETDYHAAFVRHLTDAGIPVEINANRVTAEELAEADA